MGKRGRGKGKTLKRESEASANAALLLGKDEQRAVAQEVGPVALREQIAQIEEGVDSACPVAAQMDGLAKAKVEVRFDVRRKRSNAGDGVVGAPAVACPPACSGAIEGARERDRVRLSTARVGCGNRLGQPQGGGGGSHRQGISGGVTKADLVGAAQAALHLSHYAGARVVRPGGAKQTEIGRAHV